MLSDKLRGKSALVTGATGGIGKAIVNSLVNAGVKVIAQGRSEDRLKKLSEEYPDIVCELADLSDENQVAKLAEAANACYDGLDILINNAGIGHSKSVIDLDIADFNHIMNINLRAIFILSKLIGQVMINRKDGYIINIGSGASTTPIKNMAAYCGSKYALLGFSESMALEMREYGVKVSIVMPGSTATRFGGSSPEERLGAKPGILLPEDIAESVMYLLNQPKRAWTSQINLRPLDPKRVFNS